MKKNVLGAVVFFSLLALAVLSLYIYAARTGSGHRMRELSRTAGFLEERIGALEKHRDLIGETAAALNVQAEDLQRQSEDLRHRSVELSRRVGQIDSEIMNMKDLIGGARKSARTPLFSLRGLRLTAGSGIVVIAFLAFIWLLYTSLRGRSDEEDALLGDVGRAVQADGADPVPGSVLEEEFPATGQEEAAPPTAGEETASGDEPLPPPPAEEIAPDDGRTDPPEPKAGNADAAGEESGEEKEG